MSIGMVHVYCGDGKGKTTAAMGLALRCAGNGGKVYIYQFLKNGSSGECSVLNGIEGVTMAEGFQSAKFVWNMNEEEKAEAAAYYKNKFREITALVRDGYDMLILDELMAAVGYDFVPIGEVLSFFINKPRGCEGVVAGGNADEKLNDAEERLIEAADYVSEIRKIKHPYDKGIQARKGIEF